MDESSHIGDPHPAWTGRLPVGLMISMVALAGSLAAMLICWNLRWPTDNQYAFLAHTGAGLCLTWGIVIYGLARLRPRLMTTASGHDLLSVLQIVQMAFGLLAAVLMFYVAVGAVLTRVPSLPFFKYQPQIRVDTWPSGSLDLAIVGAALLLAWWRTGDGATLTSLLWVTVLGALWAGLQIPETEVREINGISREVWVDWVSPFVLGAAVALTTLIILRELLHHRRRTTAWPDRLDDLLGPLPSWPGFGYSAGIVAAMILILGCMMLTSPLTPLSALLAGVSMLVLTHRQWEENFADAGLGLITLTVLSLLMLTVPRHDAGQAEHFASIFSRALLGLTAMTAFWHWLAAVWRQQLDNGRAWTTSGRLIRPCQRVGFLVGATGVLVLLHLAFWPRLPFVDKPDDTPARWAWGLVPSLLLVATLTRSARQTQKPTLAWLAIFAMAATMAFIINRISATAVYVNLLLNWPMILAFAAALLLLLARRAWTSSSFHPFFEPTYIMGILVLPLLAIYGAAFAGSRSIAGWMVPATFAVLSGTYLTAAFVTGPRRFIILAVVCGAAAVVTLLRI